MLKVQEQNACFFYCEKMKPSFSYIIQMLKKKTIPMIKLGNGTTLAKLKTLGEMDTSLLHYLYWCRQFFPDTPVC